MNQKEAYVKWYPDTLVHRLPKVAHLFRMLTEDVVGWGSACFSESVLSSVPYSGALIEVDKEYCISQGVLPVWNSNLSPPDSIFEKYPHYFRWVGLGTVNREYEWKSIGRMALEKDVIKSIWIDTPFIRRPDSRRNIPAYLDDELMKTQRGLTMRVLNWTKRLVNKTGYKVDTISTLRGARYNKYFKEDIKTHRDLYSREMEEVWDRRMHYRMIGMGFASSDSLPDQGQETGQESLALY